MNTSSPRWKIWLAAAALFTAGVAVGAVVTFGIGVRLIRQRLLAPAADHSFADRATARIETLLAKELTLTPDQTVKVHAALEQAASRMKSIRVDAVRDVRHALRETIVDIRTHLSPAQATQLDHLVAERLDRLGITADSP